MENDNEIEKIIMNIKQGTGTVASLIYLKAQCVMLLIQFFYRMYKEKLIKPHEFKSMQEFMKATQGRFNIMNVPQTKNLKEASLKQELDALGIRYMIFPDLNKKDGIFQVAVFADDQQKFNAVYNKKLMENMQGGKKSLEELQAVTQGSTSIVSIPLEGKDEIIKNDFSNLGVNYAILPDLKVGDGEIQVVVANVDLPKVNHWFELYKNDQLKQGNEVKDLVVINQEQYAATGELTEEEYINTGDEKVKAANEKYEGHEKGPIEQNAVLLEQKIRSMDDVEYDKLHNNPDYMEITINQQTLVEKSTFADSVMTRHPGVFASRIPTTFKNDEQTLILPKKYVFRADEGKTFIAFLKRNEKPIVLDASGKVVPKEKRMDGADIYKQYYAEVMRKFRDGQKQALKIPEPKQEENIDIAETADILKNMPSLKVPVKAK